MSQPTDFIPQPDHPLTRCPRDLGGAVPNHEIEFGDPQPVQDPGGGGPTGEFVYEAMCMVCHLEFEVPAVRRGQLALGPRPSLDQSIVAAQGGVPTWLFDNAGTPVAAVVPVHVARAGLLATGFFKNG